MRILAVGGGSGGHVTPVVAVLAKIRELEPKAEIRFWCDFGFFIQATKIIQNFEQTIKTQPVMAGKFRRYHKISWWRQLITPSIIFPNILDAFKTVFGFFQSLGLLILWRPDVIFSKGGFVCLPVGLAAFFLGIPLVTHDSDAHPGLTNRVLSHWAKAIATGAPLEYYNYPKDRTRYVGVPISADFYKFSSQEKQQARQQWNITGNKPLVVVTGGGLGAKRLNDATVALAGELTKKAVVVLISGKDQYQELKASGIEESLADFHLLSFVSKDIAKLLGSADVVVARAGATTILELASLAKPTILVPNDNLTGGHQLKNAKVYADQEAVIVFNEGDLSAGPEKLLIEIEKLLFDSTLQKKLANNFYKFAKPEAALEMAKIIIKVAKS